MSHQLQARAQAGERYTRVGQCHGEFCQRAARVSGKRDEVVLYRTAEHRYRCRVCFRFEGGRWP